MLSNLTIKNHWFDLQIPGVIYRYSHEDEPFQPRGLYRRNPILVKGVQPQLQVLALMWGKRV